MSRHEIVLSTRFIRLKSLQYGIFLLLSLLSLTSMAILVLLAWEAWFGIVKGIILFSFSDSVGILSINRSLKLLNWHSMVSSVEYSSSFGGRRFYLSYMMGFGYVLSSLDYCRCGGLWNLCKDMIVSFALVKRSTNLANLLANGGIGRHSLLIVQNDLFLYSYFLVLCIVCLRVVLLGGCFVTISMFLLHR